MAAEGDFASYTGFTVRRSNGVLTLTLDRPEVGNALASDAIPQLGQVFREAASDPEVRVLLMRATGPAFCAGGDVKGFARTIDQSPDERREDYRVRLDRAREQVEAFLALSCPVIVACQGAVAGAAVAYPLGADIALAEPGTRFVFPHQRLALPPDGGLSYLLPRTVGLRKATELVLTAAVVEAEEAVRLGMVSRVVAAEALHDEASSLAERLARAPRGAVRRARALLKGSLDRSLGEQLIAERDAIADSVAEPDFEEGVRAFMEKRRPNFPSTRD
jgi:2-(1,2-epoxy-1,2-dihydrophenyl)acetyl-CoA isomerase